LASFSLFPSPLRLGVPGQHILTLNNKCLQQVPIVSSTGGLVDTVQEGFTGFHMGAFNVDVSRVEK